MRTMRFRGPNEASSVCNSCSISSFCSSSANAQTADTNLTLGSKNTFAVLVEYANDSSHIVLGSVFGRP